jgi:hypothetical protein
LENVFLAHADFRFSSVCSPPSTTGTVVPMVEQAGSEQGKTASCNPPTALSLLVLQVDGSVKPCLRIHDIAQAHSPAASRRGSRVMTPSCPAE